MFNLKKLLPKEKIASLSQDEMIKMLKTTPEVLHQFEDYYKTAVLPNVVIPEKDDNLFDLNAKEAGKLIDQEEDTNQKEVLENVTGRIVDELLAQTKRCLVYGTNNVRLARIDDHLSSANSNQEAVTLEELMQLSEGNRPQLTGYYVKRDIEEESYRILLWNLKKMQTEKNPEKRMMYYNHFRQGLDILDLDPITYAMISKNRNTMGYWLPKLAAANQERKFFKIPRTMIVSVPLSILQTMRSVGYFGLNATTKQIINSWAIKAFDLKPDGDYFIKTGTYSNKYDFRNCHVYDPNEIAEIGEYLFFIHFQALQMAAPLSNPIRYGVSTTNEWIIREYIKDTEQSPVIYKGLPLHTEYRVFVDCDQHKVFGAFPYWEPKTMEKRFKENRDAHDKHDYIVFEAYKDVLMDRFNKNKSRLLQEISNILPYLDLPGQWSIDIMQNGDDFWLIDMARAETSFAYKNMIPEAERRPIKENWIPTFRADYSVTAFDYY